MRRVLGYVQGRAIWSDNEPAHATTHSNGGVLVTGESGKGGWSARNRELQAAYRAKRRAEKAQA